MASRTGQKAVAVLKKLQLIYKPSESPELELPQIALILHPFNVAAMSNEEWHNFCSKIQNFRKTQSCWQSCNEKGLRFDFCLESVFLVKEEEVVHKKEEHMEKKETQWHTRQRSGPVAGQIIWFLCVQQRWCLLDWRWFFKGGALFFFSYTWSLAKKGRDLGGGTYTLLDAGSICMEFALKGNHILIALFLSFFSFLSNTKALNFLWVLEKPLI